MRGILSFLAVVTSLVFLAVASPISRRQGNSQTVLTLFAGSITGIKVSNNLYKFLGIPYAQPPIGNNRFASPQAYPAGCLSEPINATAFGNECLQATGGSEDCLSLNVFTGTVSPLGLRPVMFWIHGGSFIHDTGSNPSYDGSTLASSNVVVVTYNYRLGILGFLDGGSDFPTVNMGLQDTILALQWVKNNILFFGGDPTRVTVFGQSSGATMIRALMSSPKAKNLFKRAIIESDPQMYPLENRTISRDTVGAYSLSILNCSDVACARSKSTADILSATLQTQSVAASMNGVPPAPMSPTIDGTWVAGDFSQLVATNSLPVEVDIMIGTVLNEASPQIFSISPVPLPNSYFGYIMSLFIGSSRTAAVMSNPLFALNPNDPDTVRNTLSKVGTMFIWTCAVQANAVAYSTDAHVYLYELTIGSTDPDNAADTICTSNGAVCHEDDIPLVFATYSSATSTQIAVGNEIRARWTAFAANGNPNKSGLVNWNKIGGASNLNALRIGSPSVVNQTLYSNMCGPVFGSQVLYNFQMVDS